MTNFTFKINSFTYKVKLIERETGSNYNLFASIYKGKEKSPLFGTSFKNTSTKAQIKDWALSKVRA